MPHPLRRTDPIQMVIFFCYTVVIKMEEVGATRIWLQLQILHSSKPDVFYTFVRIKVTRGDIFLSFP